MSESHSKECESLIQRLIYLLSVPLVHGRR